MNNMRLSATERKNLLIDQSIKTYLYSAICRKWIRGASRSVSLY